MGQKVSREDFEWSDTQHPHPKRCKEMLKKYPEIKQLFGFDPIFKYQVLALVVFQVMSLFFIMNYSWPVVIILAYCLGGTINHSLVLSIHDISHNLAFGHSRPLANRILGMVANLPVVIPFSVSFKRYHREHHRYQGVDVLDTDVPTKLEATLFCSTLGKFIWMFFQPFFYVLRPVITYPKNPTPLEIINTVVQLTFNVAVVYVFNGKCLGYLFASSLLGLGVHPIAGHFISEHYMFKKGFETYSYYGPLNSITFNVGYHNEHHDFPYIPSSKLPELRKIAPEYYNELPQHTSWVKVLYQFITDPSVGLYTRIKRKQAGLDKEK